jgi:type IV pilus assembly protein PilF
MSRRLAALLLAALGVAAFAMAGCSTTSTTTTSSGETSTTTGAPPTRDRVTASDESDGAKRARVRMELASAYFGRGQLTTALDEVKLAIAADPTLGEAFNLRGLIYASLGDERLAEESFRRAIVLNPRDADAMHNFGWYLCQHKRYADANAEFTRAMALPNYRGTVRTLLAQGVCYAFAGQLSEAEKTLVRSYELDPSNPSTAVNLSEVLFRRGDYERARFYVARVNANRGLASAQTLWLAVRIENKLGNTSGQQEFGGQLRERFGDSREAALLERGAFDE